MNGINLARFDYDYDTTWAAFFLDSDQNVYSRYGGRDETSPEARLTKESLLQTMREVLEVHAARQARGKGKIDDLIQPIPERETTPEDIPLLRANHRGCVHCHQVQEYRLLQAFHYREFSRDNLFRFPLPENLGIKFDRAHGHRVAEIRADSVADQAPLLAGDVITCVNDVPVHSEEDVRWALHRAADDKPLVLTATRVSKTTPPNTITWQFELTPPANWRQTELWWRKSLRSVPFSLGFLGFMLARDETRAAGAPEGGLAIRVASLRGEGLATALELKTGDLIISLAGDNRPRSLDQFKSDLLRKYIPGDMVKLTVLRDGRTLELSGKFPKWHSTETTVP